MNKKIDKTEENMRFVVITGMSGAGKSLVIKHMEDIGFFCVDNMPPSLMSKFFEIIKRGEIKFDKVAMVVDIRGGKLFKELVPTIESIKSSGFPIEVLFLEASDEVLIKRFKETRRTHPLAKTATIIKGLAEERKILQDVKDNATYVMDTSLYNIVQLKQNITDIFIKTEKLDSMVITIVSFGFKYGIPTDSDIVFDVRFIKNPFYIESMRDLNGLNTKVRDFVLGIEETNVFIQKTLDMMEYLIPYYKREGKLQLIISIGCTGGRHRSVCISKEIYEELKKKAHLVTIEHRDVDKDVRGVV